MTDLDVTEWWDCEECGLCAEPPRKVEGRNLDKVAYWDEGVCYSIGTDPGILLGLPKVTYHHCTGCDEFNEDLDAMGAMVWKCGCGGKYFTKEEAENCARGR